MIRSVLSVLAGYITMAVLVMLTMLALGAMLPSPEEDMPPGGLALVLILAAGLLAALVGGVVCARIAPDQPDGPVVALALLTGAMSVLNGLHAPPSQPLYYLVGLGLVGVSGVLLGGLLVAKSQLVP